MFIENDNEIVLPLCDDTTYIVTEENAMEWERESFEVDGTGKLQIINSGGTSASEGGMGSGSKDEKEKGDLRQPLTGEKGGTPNSDMEEHWDPVKENIDEATAKRNKRDDE
jgi:hypothetical protein